MLDLKICNLKMLASLRRLSESLILIGSALFGATFNLVTRVGLPYFWNTSDKGFNGKFTAKNDFPIGYFMLPLLTLTLEV